VSLPNRCDNKVSECRRNIIDRSVNFSLASIAVGILCVILIIIDGLSPDFRVQNLIILIMLIIIFCPVPTGLIWTYTIIRRGEKYASREYEDFFRSLEILKDKPKAETRTAIETFRGKLQKNGRGFFGSFREFIKAIDG
jgi:hypothetical protein